LFSGSSVTNKCSYSDIVCEKPDPHKHKPFRKKGLTPKLVPFIADPNSYGFRKERSTADAIDQCHTVLSNRGGGRRILEGSIKSCFDRISHQWLLDHIPMNKAILQKWLKAGFMEKQVLHATEEGTPQGGICSPALANLTLNGLERRLRERYPKATALSRKAKVNLVRYADDFIITGSSKELLEQEVKPLVESFLSERGLELSAEKTQITQEASQKHPAGPDATAKDG
jgi:RNA-directed DNA polymerase